MFDTIAKLNEFSKQTKMASNDFSISIVLVEKLVEMTRKATVFFID